MKSQNIPKETYIDIQNWLNYALFKKWHIMPKIHRGTLCPNMEECQLILYIQNNTSWPRYLIGHSLMLATYYATKLILKNDIPPLTLEKKLKPSYVAKLFIFLKTRK